MAFTLSLDDFVISYFTSGTAQTLPIAIYSMGIYVVRTSGYSRFANRPLCKDGEKADITAIFGIYSKQSDYTGGEYDYATYQLTLNRFEDMDFEKGPNAFLSEEQIASMTTEEMKYVPWMDEEGEIGE